MISLAFINGGTEEIYSTNPLYTSGLDALVEDAIHSYNEYNEKFDKFMTESSITGFENLDDLAFLESEGNNIFAKIGNAIINVLQKFTEAIGQLINKAKNIGFKNKSEMDKVEAMIKKHPDLKEKIIGHAADFDFKDIDSIAKMEEQFKQIMKATDKNVAHKILNKIKSSPGAVVGVAAGTSTIISLGTGIQKLKTNHKPLEQRLAESLDCARKNEQELNAAINRYRQNEMKAGSAAYPQARDELQILLTRLKAAQVVTRNATKSYNECVNRSAKLWGKILNACGINPRIDAERP